MNNNLLKFFRDRGNVPDLFYYQLNGKSATENYIEQKNKIYDFLESPDELDTISFTFTSEVKQ